MTAGIDYVIASLRENEQKCNFWITAISK
jgi:hypothetical protein